MAWLNPGRWLALLLLVIALGLAHNYDKRVAVKRAVAVANAEHAALAVAASEANRVKEQELILSNERVRSDYQKQKAINSALARSNADRLREYQAALDRATSSDPAASSGAYGPFAAIAGECARAIGTLDEDARGLRATAAALQEFANGLRVK